MLPLWLSFLWSACLNFGIWNLNLELRQTLSFFTQMSWSLISDTCKQRIQKISSLVAFCKLCTFSEAWFPQLCMHVCVTCSVVSDSLRPHGLYGTSGSSVHRILQARMLKWVAVPFSRESSQPRDQTHVSCIAGRFFTIWITRKLFLSYKGHNITFIWTPNMVSGTWLVVHIK